MDYHAEFLCAFLLKNSQSVGVGISVMDHYGEIESPGQSDLLPKPIDLNLWGREVSEKIETEEGRFAALPGKNHLILGWPPLRALSSCSGFFTEFAIASV